MTRPGGPSRRGRRRHVLALGTGLSLVLTLSSCSAESGAPQPGAELSRPAPSTTWTPPKGAIEPSSLPGYTPPTKTGVGSYERRQVTGGTIHWSHLDGVGQPIAQVPRVDGLVFGDQAAYSSVDGVLTLRGGPQRRSAAAGDAKVSQGRLSLAWTAPLGSLRSFGATWPGAGWTGQPLLVKWPEATRVAMGLSQDFADRGGVEVIYPAFDGQIHRLDLATGKPTKPAVDIGFGFKGTGSIDPRGYPLLYAGQGLPDNSGRRGPWQLRVVDLIRNTQSAAVYGNDPAAYRRAWGAFDSSALVHVGTDTLLEPGENGVYYRVALHSSFDAPARTVRVAPEVTRLVYRSDRSSRFGMEASQVAYRNLIYTTDNDGNLNCLDARTLEIVWSRDIGDDSDATMAIEETPEGVFLYSGNEVDHRTFHDQVANIRKINALTGELVWQYNVGTEYIESTNGGVLGSLLIGDAADVKDLVLVSSARTRPGLGGTLMALDRATGAPRWTRALDPYSWTSMLYLTGASGKTYAVFADQAGVIHLFDPTTGADVDTFATGANVEASPAAYGNVLVVASRDQKVYALTVS